MYPLVYRVLVAITSSFTDEIEVSNVTRFQIFPTVSGNVGKASHLGREYCDPWGAYDLQFRILEAPPLTTLQMDRNLDGVSADHMDISALDEGGRRLA